MKKSFFKISMIIIVVFITFFTNKKDTFAETCYWVSPFTHINDKNLPSHIQATIGYETKDISYSGVLGIDITSTKPVTSYILKYDDKYKIGYTVGRLSPAPSGASTNPKGGYNIYLTGSYGSIKSDKKPGSDCSKYKYVKASTTSFTNFKVSISGVSESEYVSYLKNGGQTRNLFENKLYGFYTLYAYTTKNNFTKINDRDYDGDHKDSFYDMIEKTGGDIYFVNTGQSETYPTTNLNNFKKMIKDADSGATISEDEALKGLGTVIDTGSKDTITYTKAYFDATKSAWQSYMNSDLSTKKGDETRRSYFSQWYTKSVARYEFETDLEEFLKYWKYIYQKDCTTTTCDLDGDGDNDDRDRQYYNNIVTIIESQLGYTKASSCIDKIEKDPCLSTCVTDTKKCNTQLGTSCTNSTTYKNCKTCLESCTDKNTTTCNDKCTSKKYSSTKTSLDKSKQDSSNAAAKASKTLYTLSRADAPSLNVEFEPYKVKCSDVKIFHKYYVMLEIIAPIAVILFGTLDYAKAVISSDVEKMEKSKKKFPKRILALVIFVLVPVIVSLLVNSFSGTNADLMRCIINGK